MELVGKVLPLLFNMLFRFVIAFLLRSKHFLILWLQSQSAVILEHKKRKSATVSTFSPSVCHEVMGADAMILIFWMLSLSQLFHSPPAIRVVSSVYLRLLSLLAILIPAWASSNPAFYMMYSAYKLNKQGNNIQSWCTPFPIWNQSVVPCPVLTVASLPAYKFLRRQVRCSGIQISRRIFHSLLWST